MSLQRLWQTAPRCVVVCRRCHSTLERMSRASAVQRHDELQIAGEWRLGKVELGTTGGPVQKYLHTSGVVSKHDPNWRRWKKKFREVKPKKTYLEELEHACVDKPEVEDDVTASTPEEERERLIYVSLERLAEGLKSRNVSSINHLGYRPQIVQIVDLLQKNKFPSSNILKVASDQQVLETAFQDLNAFVQTGLEEGFTKKQICNILACNARAARLKHEEVDTLISTLRSLGCPTKVALTVLASHPILFSRNPNNICDRYNHLIDFFTSKEIIHLMFRSPELLTTPWQEIEDKYYYVKDVMNLDVKYMSETSIFKYPLAHIIARHTFLERTKQFVKPNKNGLSPINNPSLKEIVDSTDRVFSVKIAGLSVAEYRAYERMLELDELDRELEEEEDDLEDEEEMEESS